MRSPKAWLSAFGLGLALFTGCGGGGNSTPAPAPGGINNNNTSPTCATGALAAVKNPTLVTVSGLPATGIDIDVGGPQACPTPNAQDLGVADLGASTITASNIGAQIHRGDSKIVILFGAGLASVTSVTISGQPNDFVVTSITHPSAKDGTPGVQFTIAVSPTAALGARTVVLRAANDDISTFTGGLEVIP